MINESNQNGAYVNFDEDPSLNVDISPVDIWSISTPKTRTQWYHTDNPQVRSYITGNLAPNISGRGARSLQRAAREYQHLSEDFARRGYSSKAMSRKYDNFNGIDSSLLDLALENENNKLKTYQDQFNSGQINGRQFSRLQQRQQRRIGNLNENYSTLAEISANKRGVQLIRTQSSVSPAPFVLGTVGLPLLIYGGLTGAVKAAPFIGKTSRFIGRTMSKPWAIRAATGLDILDTGYSIATGDYLGAAVNWLPYDKAFKWGKRAINTGYDFLKRSVSQASDLGQMGRRMFSNSPYQPSLAYATPSNGSVMFDSPKPFNSSSDEILDYTSIPSHGGGSGDEILDYTSIPSHGGGSGDEILDYTSQNNLPPASKSKAGDDDLVTDVTLLDDTKIVDDSPLLEDSDLISDVSRKSDDSDLISDVSLKSDASDLRSGPALFVDRALISSTVPTGPQFQKLSRYAGTPIPYNPVARPVHLIYKKPTTSRGVSINQELTNNFVNFVNSNSNATAIGTWVDPVSMKFYIDRGIDPSKLTPDVVVKADDIARRSAKSAFAGKTGTIVYPSNGPDTFVYYRNGNMTGRFNASLTKYPDSSYIKYANNYDPKSGLTIDEYLDKFPGHQMLAYHSDMIESYAPSKKGVSEDLYNSAIKYGQLQYGIPGVVSGEFLLSPEATTNVWKRYKGKQYLGNFGTRRYGGGIFVDSSRYQPIWVEDFDGKLKYTPHYTTRNNPVYLLTKPTKDLPVKVGNLLDPTRIVKQTDGTFKLTPLNLKSNDLYKVFAPITGGAAGMYFTFGNNNNQ